jgi:hypothetical protein
MGFKSWQIAEKMVQPFGRDVPLFTCGEAFSSEQGWIEGALKSAERVLEALGMQEPSTPRGSAGGVVVTTPLNKCSVAFSIGACSRILIAIRPTAAVAPTELVWRAPLKLFSTGERGSWPLQSLRFSRHTRLPAIPPKTGWHPGPEPSIACLGRPRPRSNKSRIAANLKRSFSL